MLLLAVRELMSRRTATLLAGAGLLTATLGFMILAATSQTTTALLRGDIGTAWNSPYDILVRPAAATTALERRQGLVRPNFLGAVTGGITDRQLEAIRGISGVDVAAPVAVAGELYFFTEQFIDLLPDMAKSGFSAFRLMQVRSADAGMSTYPATEIIYILAASNGTLLISNPGPNQVVTLNVQGRLITCDPSVSCAAPRVVCDPPGSSCPHTTASGWLVSGTRFDIPMVVAGIDPPAEGRMAGLDRCLTDGRYLNSFDAPQVNAPSSSRLGSIVLPALLSTRTPVDESIRLDVARIDDPGLASASATELSGLGAWHQVDSRKWTSQDFYQTIFNQLHGGLTFSNSYTAGDVDYTRIGGQLTATTTAPDLSIYRSSGFGGEVPPDALDDWFRPVTVRAAVDYVSGTGTVPIFNPLGQYNPNCLASFNPLAGGRLETYAQPYVTLPDGRRLGPNASLGGYVNAPPSVLTNLASIKAFEDPSRYAGSPGAAYISAIRVRLSGVEHPGSDSEHKLATIAAEIREATNLQVDIIKGASPRPLKVGLPAGLFGRPALIVTEPWSVKGVAFIFSRAVTAQNLALFGLVLVGAMVLVGQTGYVSVRRRRREFGVLRALGWPASSITWLVELEMLLLGLCAGIVALIAGIPIVSRLGMGTTAWQLGAVVPIALAIAALAGLVPAIEAGRGSSVAAMESMSPAAITDRHPPNGVAGVAWRELRGQWRVEGALGAAAIALGASILGVVVVISVAFRGQLDTTVLGAYLAGQVRPFHFMLAGLTLVVGAIAAAEVVTLGYLERRAHLGALRALGWPAWAVVRLLISQAVVLGAAGATASAIAVIAAGLVLGTPFTAIASGLLAAVGMALVATAIAVVAPLAYAYHANPADALRGE